MFAMCRRLKALCQAFAVSTCASIAGDQERMHLMSSEGMDQAGGARDEVRLNALAATTAPGCKAATVAPVPPVYFLLLGGRIARFTQPPLAFQILSLEQMLSTSLMRLASILLSRQVICTAV